VHLQTLEQGQWLGWVVKQELEEVLKRVPQGCDLPDLCLTWKPTATGGGGAGEPGCWWLGFHLSFLVELALGFLGKFLEYLFRTDKGELLQASWDMGNAGRFYSPAAVALSQWMRTSTPATWNSGLRGENGTGG
jgi:hypothetical protein